MPSTPRNFKSGRPIVASFRINFRMRVFEKERRLVRLFLRLLVKWAEAYEVAVLGYAVMGNHVHLILVQYFDGHQRRRGIAAVMRAMLGELGLAINEVLGREGRITERTYRSWNLTTAGDLLRQMAYVHGQGAHHGGSALADSWETHVDVAAADGVITRMPVLVGVDTDDPEARAEALEALLRGIIAEATELEADQRRTDAGEDVGAARRADAANPWKTATERIAAATGLAVDLEADVRELEYLEVCGIGAAKAAAFRASRAQVLREVWPRFTTSRRRPAPEVGDVIEIHIRSEDEAPPTG